MHEVVFVKNSCYLTEQGIFVALCSVHFVDDGVYAEEPR
mgnify:CR=1 FL=1